MTMILGSHFTSNPAVVPAVPVTAAESSTWVHLFCQISATYCLVTDYVTIARAIGMKRGS